MKRFVLFHTFIFALLLIVVSCGSDNKISAKPAKSTNSLTGAECACNTSGIPVCGINTSGNQIDYPNKCVASCYKATSITEGHCDCSEATRVCTVDGQDRTECEATQLYRISIKNYGTCSNPVTTY